MQGLTLLAPLQLLVSHLALGHLNVVFLTQPLQGLEERHVLVLLQEREYITALTANEALERLTDRTHHHRRGVVVMEGTHSLVIDTCLLERNKLANHIDDVRGFLDFIYCIFQIQHNFSL